LQSFAPNYYLQLGNQDSAEADKGHSDYEAKKKIIERNLGIAKQAFADAVKKCEDMKP
jgi:hypothetical protein